jgi:hypothetical protein
MNAAPDTAKRVGAAISSELRHAVELFLGKRTLSLRLLGCYGISFPGIPNSAEHVFSLHTASWLYDLSAAVYFDPPGTSTTRHENRYFLHVGDTHRLQHVAVATAP